MRGYKVFNPDWTCRGFRFTVGETYEEDVKPSCCKSGFHFCTELKDCFSYYSFSPDNKVAEIEALGDIDTETGDRKCCTNKIKIVRELTWEEVLRLVNTGKDNTGFGNSGDRNSGYYNSGDYNSGDWNSGNRNSGNRNSGYRNSGNRNSGYYNSGYYNSGDYNSGDYNSGDWNSGDWNKTNFSSGCFNTEESKILMFNKSSNWTLRDWHNSEARNLLNNLRHSILEWINACDMTGEEKEQHPEHKTTGGYLKRLDKSECGQNWWNGLTDRKKAVIKSLPNFDAEIFEEITGINVNLSEETNNEQNTQAQVHAQNE